MITASVILLPILLASVWFFVRAQPSTSRIAALRRFNVYVAVIAALAVCLVTLYFWNTTGQSIDRAWWPVLATLASVLMVAIVLVFGIVVRFVLFREGASQ
jgi:hypothetical protein